VVEGSEYLDLILQESHEYLLGDFGKLHDLNSDYLSRNSMFALIDLAELTNPNFIARVIAIIVNGFLNY
jgi:hypothetical protein